MERVEAEVAHIVQEAAKELSVKFGYRGYPRP
jgi:hypothetical protein